MYESQEELNMIAQAAKQQLTQQSGSEIQTASNEDLYAGLGLYDKGGYDTNTEQSNLYPQAKIEEENTVDDHETVMNNINTPPPILDMFDEELFPGGPTKSEINLWKKEWDGYDIYVTEILKETFVFRTLNRFEYKQLVSFVDINALQREETICSTVTLWPSNYDYNAMATTKAGIPSTYSEIIMEKSGFTKDFAIQEI